MIGKLGMDYLNSQLPITLEEDSLLETVFLSRYCASEKGKTTLNDHIWLTAVGNALQRVLLAQYLLLNCWQDERMQGELSASVNPNFSGMMLEGYDSLRECYVLTNTAMDISFRNDEQTDPYITSRLFAYVYFKIGYDAAYSIVETLFSKMNLREVAKRLIIENYSKTILQEITQRNAGPQPMYVMDREGLAHKSVFTCMVVLGSKNATGTGSRKKEAEMAAAKNYILKYHPNDPAVGKYCTPFTKAIFADSSMQVYSPENRRLKDLGLDGRLLRSCLYTTDVYKPMKRDVRILYQGNMGIFGDRLMCLLNALILKEMLDGNELEGVFANLEFPSVSPSDQLYLSIADCYSLKNEMIAVNKKGVPTDTQIAESMRGILSAIFMSKIAKKDKLTDVLACYDTQVHKIIKEFIAGRFQSTDTARTEHFINPATTLADFMGICKWDVTVDSAVPVPFKDAPKCQQGMGFEAVVSLSVNGKKIGHAKGIGVSKKEATNLAKEKVWKFIYERFLTWEPKDPIIRSAFAAYCGPGRSPKSRQLVYDLLLSRLPNNPIELSKHSEQACSYIRFQYSAGRRDLDYEMDWLLDHFIKTADDVTMIDSLLSGCPELLTDERYNRINIIIMSGSK